MPEIVKPQARFCLPAAKVFPDGVTLGDLMQRSCSSAAQNGPCHHDGGRARHTGTRPPRPAAITSSRCVVLAEAILVEGVAGRGKTMTVV